MANEAVLVIETDRPINFNISGGTAITKGALMKTSDGFGAVQQAGASDKIAGFLWGDIISSDGVTSAAIYRKGYFRCYISGSVTYGDALCSDSSLNYLKTAPILTSGSMIVGRAMQTGTTGQQIIVDVDVGHTDCP